MTNEIRAGNVAPRALGRFQSDASFAKALRREDQLRRNYAVLQNLLFVIDVVDEQIQRVNALAQTAIDLSPFIGRNDPGNDVEWKDLLSAGLVAVDIKGHARPKQGLLS